MSETLEIYVWPDGSWESEEEIDDMDWYLTSCGKSDDYATYDIPLELDAEDIDELIKLQALPGMLKETVDFQGEGEVALPEGSVLIIKHPKEMSSSSVMHLDGRIMITSPGLSIEVLKGGK